MACSKAVSLLGLAISTAIAIIGCALEAAQAQTSLCYEVQDSDGWTYVRDLGTREIRGKLDNGTTFRSLDQTEYGSVIIGGFSESRLVVARSRVRPVSGDRCRWKYFMVGDRDGYINLRSAPNGSIIGRIADQSTVLSIKKSADETWTRVISDQGKIGWIHSSRLAEIAN